MADGSSHAAHLPVSPFDQFQSNPTVLNIFAKPNWGIARRQFRLWLQQPGATRQSLSPLNQHPFRQFPQRLGGWDSLNLRPVTATMTVRRVEQAFVQFRFVTTQQQSFAVAVEPRDRLSTRRKTELRQCAEIRSVGCKLRYDAVRLVEGD